MPVVRQVPLRLSLPSPAAPEVLGATEAAGARPRPRRRDGAARGAASTLRPALAARGASNRQRGRYRPPRAARTPAGGKFPEAELRRPRPRTRREAPWTGWPGMSEKRGQGTWAAERGAQEATCQPADRTRRGGGMPAAPAARLPRSALGTWNTSEVRRPPPPRCFHFSGSAGFSHMSGVMRTGKPTGLPEHPAPRREERATGSPALTSPRPHPEVFTFEKWWRLQVPEERNGQERLGLRGLPATRSKPKGCSCACSLLPHPTDGSQVLPSLPSPSP